MKQAMVLSLILLAGCYQDEYRQTLAQWQAWRDSFAHGDLVGKTFDEVTAVWGLPNEVQESVIGQMRIATLIYSHKGFDSEWGMIRTVETYHLVFVNGRLDTCHRF